MILGICQKCGQMDWLNIDTDGRCVCDLCFYHIENQTDDSTHTTVDDEFIKVKFLMQSIDMIKEFRDFLPPQRKLKKIRFSSEEGCSVKRLWRDWFDEISEERRKADIPQNDRRGFTGILDFICGISIEESNIIPMNVMVWDFDDEFLPKSRIFIYKYNRYYELEDIKLPKLKSEDKKYNFTNFFRFGYDNNNQSLVLPCS